MSYFRLFNVQMWQCDDMAITQSLHYLKNSRMEKQLAHCRIDSLSHCFVGRSGFEPLKSKDSGFTVRPIWPLWNLPYWWCFHHFPPVLSHLPESNWRPTDYKSVALPAELRWQFSLRRRTSLIKFPATSPFRPQKSGNLFSYKELNPKFLGRQR